MPSYHPTSERNLDGYGTPPIEWARVAEVLDSTLSGPRNRWPEPAHDLADDHQP